MRYRNTVFPIRIRIHGNFFLRQGWKQPPPELNVRLLGRRRRMDRYSIHGQLEQGPARVCCNLRTRDSPRRKAGDFDLVFSGFEPSPIIVDGVGGKFLLPVPFWGKFRQDGGVDDWCGQALRP